MTPNRDWSAYGLTNPPEDGDYSPERQGKWLADVLWVLLKRQTGVELANERGHAEIKARVEVLRVGGCQKWQRLKWVVLGALAVGIASGVFGPKLAALLSAII